MTENVPINTNVPAADDANKRKNKIKVSSAKSVFFYVDLATRFLKQEEEVELSGLGFGKPSFEDNVVLLLTTTKAITNCCHNI